MSGGISWSNVIYLLLSLFFLIFNVLLQHAGKSLIYLPLITKTESVEDITANGTEPYVFLILCSRLFFASSNLISAVKLFMSLKDIEKL